MICLILSANHKHDECRDCCAQSIYYLYSADCKYLKTASMSSNQHWLCSSWSHQEVSISCKDYHVILCHKGSCSSPPNLSNNHRILLSKPTLHMMSPIIDQSLRFTETAKSSEWQLSEATGIGIRHTADSNWRRRRKRFAHCFCNRSASVIKEFYSCLPACTYFSALEVEY